MTVDEFKIKWMLENGFTKNWCNHRDATSYEYKGYSWTLDDIKNTSTPVIMRYKKWYDGLITEKELERAIKFDINFKQKALDNSKELLKVFKSAVN